MGRTLTVRTSPPETPASAAPGGKRKRSASLASSPRGSEASSARSTGSSPASSEVFHSPKEVLDSPSSRDSFVTARSHASPQSARSESTSAATPSSKVDPPGLDVATLIDTHKEASQKALHAKGRLVAQVVGAGFLVATLVATAVLCPPALALVGPVCVFAGHALYGLFSKTLGELELANRTIDSAAKFLSGAGDADFTPRQLPPAPAKAPVGGSPTADSPAKATRIAPLDPPAAAGAPRTPPQFEEAYYQEAKRYLAEYSQLLDEEAHAGRSLNDLQARRHAEEAEAKQSLTAIQTRLRDTAEGLKPYLVG